MRFHDVVHMAVLELNLPDGRVIPLAVPDGPQYVPVTLKACACGFCEPEWFQPAEPTQVYVNEEHRARANNAKRARKTDRRKK